MAGPVQQDVEGLGGRALERYRAIANKRGRADGHDAGIG
jgi:hypothetical protein